MADKSETAGIGLSTLSNVAGDIKNFLTTAKDWLEGKKEKENFSGGLASKVMDYVNEGYMFLQNNAIELEDIQLNIAKQLGGSQATAMASMGAALDITRRTAIDQKYGFAAQDYAQALSNIQTNLGKKVGLSEIDAKNFAAADNIFGDSGKTMSEISAAFMQVGSNMESASDTVAKMFSNATKSGLSFQKISATVKAHLKEVNQYGFKNGIDGMRQMAEYAEQIGMDMNQVLRATEKTSSLTGVTDVAARLSVLGGNFQQLSNPLEMLNESLTDVESYQKRIGDMFKGMAKWDASKGMISVSAVDRMRINEAASAMGLDKNEVFKSVETQARRDMIEKQVGASVDEDLKNLVANIGTINKEGRAGIVDKEGKFRDVSEIAGNAELQQEIRDMNRTEGETIEQISDNLISWKKESLNFYQMLVNRKTSIEFGEGGERFKKSREAYSEELRGTQTGTSPLGTIINELHNAQEASTQGITTIRNFVDNELSSAVKSAQSLLDNINKLWFKENGKNGTAVSVKKDEVQKAEDKNAKSEPSATKSTSVESVTVKQTETPTVVVTQPQQSTPIQEVSSNNTQSTTSGGNGVNINLTVNPVAGFNLTPEEERKLSERMKTTAKETFEEIYRERKAKESITTTGSYSV